MDLPDKPSEKLSGEQRKAFDVMRELLMNLDEADRRYDALKPSQSGKIVSTDIARYLDVRYTRKPPKGGGRDLNPGWDLAWRYAQNRLAREISKRGKRKILRLMAGGWGAGKTFALEKEKEINQDPDLIWDGTLSNPTWAISVIDSALNFGWKIEVAYVYRDLELALYGAVEREREEGRGVPIIELPKNHRDTQRSVLDLSSLYWDEKSVSILYLHNLGTTEVPAGTPVVNRIDLELNGALHYLERHEQYYSKAAEKLS